MERNRSGQIIAIVALVASAVGISLGFAAYSSTLTIQSSADITGALFDVDFSTDGSRDTTNTAIGKEGNVTPTYSHVNTATADPTGDTATISNTGSGTPVISGLHASFTEPGQTVTYSFYSINVGDLDAYLREVNFANASGAQSWKSCTSHDSQDPVTPGLLTAACGDISLTVTVGGTPFSAASGSNTSISGHSLLVGANETVVVTITYAKTGTNGNRVDGDVDVAFGDITLVYRSLDATS